MRTCHSRAWSASWERHSPTAAGYARWRSTRAGRDLAAGRGIIIADTKFEFGLDADGSPMLIDEVLTPDSSRFWPADGYAPGRTQPSFDKQPLRDWLAGERSAGRWNGNAPPPALPDAVVAATSARYREAYRRLVGRELGPEHDARCAARVGR